MPQGSFAVLHRQIRALVQTGQICIGYPGVEILKWLKQARDCLLALEHRFPTLVAEFNECHREASFNVELDGEENLTKSAFQPCMTDGPQIAIDFRFLLLWRVTELLDLAASRLEMDGHAISTLGQRLREARKAAGHIQFKTGHELGVSAQTISIWERTGIFLRT